MSALPTKRQPTVFILYIPGGAALGLIPALTLAHIEDLIETPIGQAFQVKEGVSTGSILVAGLSVGISAKKSAALFSRHVDKILPNIPGRLRKMHLRDGFNMARDYFGLDPRQNDHIAIKNISRLCDLMREKSASADPSLIDFYEQEATKRWLTTGTQSALLKLAQRINAQDGGLEKYTYAVAELVDGRTYTGRLKIPFQWAAATTLNILKDVLAKKDACYIDPSLRQTLFKDIFGDRTVGNSVGSTYISTYDAVENRVVTFSCLKKNIFDTAPDAPATVKNNTPLWDAVMASTANKVLYPPHLTETGILCSDKAIIHRPRSVNDVIDAAPRGMKIVLVVAGTGKFLSNDLLHFMGENTVAAPDSPAIRRKLEHLRDHYAESGVLRTLFMGKETAELEEYTFSCAMDDFREKLGVDNVFDFTPRLAPHTPQEWKEFPSRVSMDTSPENIEKIRRRAHQNNKERSADICKLAQRLADNLYMTGQMDRTKYSRVCSRIGKSASPAQTPPEKPSIKSRLRFLSPSQWF